MTNQIPTGSPTAKLNSGKFNAPYKFTSSDLLQGFSDADNNPYKSFQSPLKMTKYQKITVLLLSRLTKILAAMCRLSI